MNQMIHALAIASMLLVAHANAIAIPLGSCAPFSVKAGTAVSFNGGLTTVNTGNVGVAPGNIITGSFKVSAGTIENNSPSANACTKDIQIAYNASVAAPCPAANIYAELSGLTLAPGVYCSGSEMKFSASTLTLDGQGDPNAQWIFQVKTALTTASSTEIILQNGANAENIFWALGTSATLGYSSSFAGSILARTAITFGTQSAISGRALALTAISFESASSVTLPISPSSSAKMMSAASISTTEVPLVLGGCAYFAVLAGTSVNFNGAKTKVAGSVGVSPGNAIGGSYEIHGGTEEHNSPLAKSCAASLATLYNQASSATCSANHTLQSADLAGLVLTPGTYCSATGTFEFSAAALTLDAEGNADAQWIFQASTTLSTATATSFKLINGAQASNVFWAIGTSASIGYSSDFVGNIIAQGAINYDTSANVVGRGLAMTAITFASQGVITLPSPVSV